MEIYQSIFFCVFFFKENLILDNFPYFTYCLEDIHCKSKLLLLQSLDCNFPAKNDCILHTFPVCLPWPPAPMTPNSHRSTDSGPGPDWAPSATTGQNVRQLHSVIEDRTTSTVWDFSLSLWLTSIYWVSSQIMWFHRLLHISKFESLQIICSLTRGTHTLAAGWTFSIASRANTGRPTHLPPVVTPMVCPQF